MADFLRYGAMGLGLALALLAFFLLKEEQRMSRPRAVMVKTIHVFMAFALALTCLGFALEYLKSTQAAAAQGSSKHAEAKLDRIRAAAAPLLRARRPTIDSLPESPQKQQLLVFQEELRKILDDERQ